MSCFNPENFDRNYTKFVGYNESNLCICKFFSKCNMDYLSEQITKSLQGVDPSGRPIIVSPEVIGNVMSSVVDSNQPMVGDIYSRYTLASLADENNLVSLNDRTIEIIVSHITNELEMTQNNNKLSIWTGQIYGDMNKEGLLQHPPIKLRERRPQSMLFNLHY